MTDEPYGQDAINAATDEYRNSIEGLYAELHTQIVDGGTPDVKRLLLTVHVQICGIAQADGSVTRARYLGCGDGYKCKDAEAIEALPDYGEAE